MAAVLPSLKMRRLFSLALTTSLLCTWSLPTALAQGVESVQPDTAEPGADEGDDVEADVSDDGGEDAGEDSSEDDVSTDSSEASPTPTATTAPATTGESDITIAVLPILVSGELAEAVRQRLFESLRRGLQRGQFGLANQATIDEVARTGCADQICYRKIRNRTKSSYIVRTFVTISDRDYIIHLDLVDVEENEVVASSEETCEVCGASEVGAVLDAQAAQFRTKLEALIKEPPMVVVNSDPKGALVTIDNVVVGVTPLERKVLPGEHVIRVSTDGFVPEERELVSVAGVRETVAVEMARTPQSIRNRKLGVGFVASGVPILVGGIVTTALDIQFCHPDNMGLAPDNAGNCPFLARTAVFGAPIIGVGAVLTTLGAVLLYRQKNRQKGKKSLRAGVSPTGVSLSGRF